MSRKGSPRRLIPISILFLTFAAGVAVGWSIHAPQSSTAVLFRRGDVPLPTGTAGRQTAARAVTEAATDAASQVRIDRSTPTSLASDDDPMAALKARGLRVPIDGANVSAMKGQFGDTRDAGARGHEAVDILAPRNTPVHAVEDGTIAKLFLSKLGGNTIYQFDPKSRFCYYYAHLERYEPGLHEGQRVSRGDVIGYVGTSGNAPPNTPHLHFAIFLLTPEHHWWQGTPLDPWAAFSH
jgi:murein DD-endopeptidase MepM/ murein hydrolase activator NlpD